MGAGASIDDEGDLKKVYEQQKADGTITEQQAEELVKEYNDVKASKKGANEFLVIGKCKKKYDQLGIGAGAADSTPAPSPAPAPAPAPAPEIKPYPSPPKDFTCKAGGKDIVVCNMEEMPAAIKAAQNAGLTPLVVDRSADHLCDTFWQYSASMFDAKKMALDVSVRKQPLLEVMDASRKALTGAISHGMTWVISCQSSCPDFVATFNDTNAKANGFASAGKPFPGASAGEKSLFPIEIFNNSGLDFIKPENLKSAESLFREEDELAGGQAKIVGEFDEEGKFKSGFNVIVSTHFSFEDIDDFLFNGEYGLPPGKFQPIWIQHMDNTPLCE